MNSQSIIRMAKECYQYALFATLVITVVVISCKAQAQNVGIGTDTPDQKLEVDGNIKLGNNIMVEGNDDLKIYRNLVGYRTPGAGVTGAYVIHTNLPATSTQWLVRIEGYCYNPLSLFNIFISGYGIDVSKSGNLYDGYNKLPVQMGTESGNLVFIIGSISGSYGFIQIAVTELQVCYSNLDESYADGWTITRETSLAAFSSVAAIPERTYLQWGENGSDIYRSSGDVGIGTTNPLYPLDILYNSDASSSRGLNIVNESTGSTGQTISAIKGVIKSTGTTNTRGAIYGIHDNTTGNASGVYGWTGSSAGYGVTGRNGSSTRVGYLGTGSYAVYGNSSWNTSTGNYGYLGSSSYGAYAKHYSSGNYGYIGNSNYGVYGRYGGAANYGYLGGSTCGVYGDIASTVADGSFGVIGIGATATTPVGSGYGALEGNGGVKGYNTFGNNYTFGVAGYSSLGSTRSGGCLGSDNFDDTPWGCLAYHYSGGTLYGGYFTSHVTGPSGGKDNAGEVYQNNGIGSWGGLFGADIHGEIYGIYTEGNNYGLYSNGHIFRNKLDIHLQEDENQSNTILFTNVSTDVTIQTSGYAQLSNGRCQVSFDENFRSVASETVPVVVTVTPVGSCQGVYLEQVDASGFVVAENNGGRSEVELSYIAIARRKGYENPQLPEEVVDHDYLNKLDRGLHNDAYKDTNGEGLYYKNGQLYLGSINSKKIKENISH